MRFQEKTLRIIETAKTILAAHNKTDRLRAGCEV